MARIIVVLEPPGFAAPVTAHALDRGTTDYRLEERAQ